MTGNPTALTVQNLMAETVELRFGPGTKQFPHPIEWLSDNGPVYTAHTARAFRRGLGFVICKHAVVLAQVERDGSGICESLETRLRVRQRLKGYGARASAFARLVCRL